MCTARRKRWRHVARRRAGRTWGGVPRGISPASGTTPAGTVPVRSAAFSTRRGGFAAAGNGSCPVRTTTSSLPSRASSTALAPQQAAARRGPLLHRSQLPARPTGRSTVSGCSGRHPGDTPHLGSDAAASSAFALSRLGRRARSDRHLALHPRHPGADPTARQALSWSLPRSARAAVASGQAPGPEPHVRAAGLAAPRSARPMQVESSRRAAVSTRHRCLALPGPLRPRGPFSKSAAPQLYRRHRHLSLRRLAQSASIRSTICLRHVAPGARVSASTATARTAAESAYRPRLGSLRAHQSQRRRAGKAANQRSRAASDRRASSLDTAALSPRTATHLPSVPTQAHHPTSSPGLATTSGPDDRPCVDTPSSAPHLLLELCPIGAGSTRRRKLRAPSTIDLDEFHHHDSGLRRIRAFFASRQSAPNSIAKHCRDRAASPNPPLQRTPPYRARTTARETGSPATRRLTSLACVAAELLSR